MSLAATLKESARACDGAAFALAHALRPEASKSNPPSDVVATFQEAQAFSISCRAVMDEAAPLIPFLTADAPCVGKKALTTSGPTAICNGFDTLAAILVDLLDHANHAILAVAANHSRWLVTPIQTTVAFDRMVTHHRQLRAFYGIIHLAAKIVSYVPDLSQNIFVSLVDHIDPDAAHPAKWRAAINLDDFYGRHFGFHYTPEMRNVLRVVNIVRGSIHRSHTENDDTTPQLIKNVAMLGWGWIYSNMVIMNNLGISIDGVSNIGADSNSDAMTIERLRKFMNLAEEPLVAGVSGLASADVAVNSAFEIPPSGYPGGLQAASEEDALRDVLENVTESVTVRLLSSKGRPIDMPKASKKASPTSQSKDGQKALAENGEESVKSPVVSPQKPVQPTSNQIASSSVEGAVAVVDNSFLASTLKTELRRLQSNVSSLLGIEEKKPAKGLIMHFHGGGFVSQSSEADSVYLREWCADVTDAVIFSVDYRLAPEHKFPRAVYECVYAYVWALQNAGRLGTLAERVVFCGDSAGGNLALATALKVNEVGIRAADGICVAYPSLYVTMAWSPSRLLSFFDPLLPLSVLELCLKSYVPEGEKGETNALISPAVSSREELERLPPVTVVCGGLDPLLDDSAWFMHRLRGVRGGDAFHVCPKLPHGFLNMNLVNEEARKALRMLTKMSAEYMDLPFRNGDDRGTRGERDSRDSGGGGERRDSSGGGL